MRPLQGCAFDGVVRTLLSCLSLSRPPLSLSARARLFKSEGKGAGTERGGLLRPCSDTFRPPRESRSQQQQQRRHQQQEQQQQQQEQGQGVVMARKAAASAPPAVPAPLSPRPATRSSARFGNLSQHSFFSRHNPHPQRVRHIRGLNDVPICSVNDEGFVSSPRYSLSLSPLRALLLRCGLSASSPGSPAGVGPLPFTLPFPTTPSSLQQQQHGGGGGGERGSVPRVGPVSLTDAWRDELRELTERAGFLARREKKPQPEGPALRPGTRYSLATGRIVPPPSRAASRTPGRLSSRNGARDFAAHGDPDHELLVLELLCQILQTDSISAVKEWLLAAGPREKDLVLAMIRIALEDEAGPQPPAPHADPRPDSQSSLRKTPRSRMGNRSRSVEAHVPESIPEEEEPERVGDAEVLTIQRSSSADDITRSAASRPRVPRASAGPTGAARAAEADVAPASASAKPRSGRKAEQQQQQQQHQLPAAPVDAKLRYTKTPHTPGESAQRPAQPKHSAAQI
ncbi:protein TBATA-like isoform X1 [Petromyzon marinus]|uniref:protein TBATA-like isoform X1 n=2 Tax=Petromyzon marinus TaxID=7757 RepID=UPI003F725303